jgi:hypothetical protein
VSTATLDVWVTKVGEPCRIDDTRTWYVHILHCNGEILEWCGRRYANLPTKCGQLEVQVPPGCYMVVATWSPGASAPVPTTLGNHISHLQIVRVNCDEHVCVTLFPPTLHWCGIWWLFALREATTVGGTAMPQAAQRQAQEAMRAAEAFLKAIPADPLAMQMMKIEQEPRPKGEAVAPKSSSKKGGGGKSQG